MIMKKTAFSIFDESCIGSLLLFITMDTMFSPFTLMELIFIQLSSACGWICWQKQTYTDQMCHSIEFLFVKWKNITWWENYSWFSKEPNKLNVQQITLSCVVDIAFSFVLVNIFVGLCLLKSLINLDRALTFSFCCKERRGLHCYGGWQFSPPLFKFLFPEFQHINKHI